MAEVNGADSSEFAARFDQQLEEARGCFGVEMLPQSGQKHAVQALRQYASALEQMDGDQRGQLMQIILLLPRQVKGCAIVFILREQLENPKEHLLVTAM